MNNIRPKVSIIIPTYNRGNQLRICLKSLQKQTFQNFEVIVCDDGSTDNTSEVIDEFKNLFSLTYIQDENFGGPARPRNNGLKIAKGELIAFLDSDDWWYPNKLEVSLEFLSDSDIVYHDLDIYKTLEKSEGVAKSRILRENVSKDLIINGNGITNSSVVIRKDIIDIVGEITEDKNLIAVEDCDYWIRVGKVTDRFKYINQSLGAYWVGDNISYSVKQIGREMNLLNKYLPDLSLKERDVAISLHNFTAARMYHYLSLFSEARTSYSIAMKTRDTSRKMKSILGYVMCCFKIK